MRTLLWRDMLDIGTAVNILATFVALMVASQGLRIGSQGPSTSHDCPTTSSSPPLSTTPKTGPVGGHTGPRVVGGDGSRLAGRCPRSQTSRTRTSSATRFSGM